MSYRMVQYRLSLLPDRNNLISIRQKNLQLSMQVQTVNSKVEDCSVFLEE